MGKKRLNLGKKGLALLLCGCLFWAGPARPIGVFASVDEVEEVEEETDSGWEGDDDEDDGLTEPGASYDNSQLQELQQQHDKLQSDLKKFQEQQKQIQAKIDGAKNEKQKAEQRRNNVGNQIAITQGEIATLEEKITTLEQMVVKLEQRIDQKLDDIAAKQKEIDASYALFKKRLRARQMEDNSSLLSLLLGAGSFSDFLTRTENMARIAQHDQELMDQLTDQRKKIEEEKVELEEEQRDVEAKKGEVEADKTTYVAKKQEYQVQYDAAQSQVMDIAREEQEFLADLANNQARQEKMRAEINSIFQKMEFIKSPYAGGAMLWPLPGHTKISSYFGSRFGGKDYHTGIDIYGTGCYGSNIVAANSGTVSFVNSAGSTGYGIYVIVDHGVQDGQNISTLYAHCSSIVVSQGQEVRKGDVIAKVGSTGWSTGPHLHFEVRVGTGAVNPLPYVKG